jgi:hypothetical protein
MWMRCQFDVPAALSRRKNLCTHYTGGRSCPRCVCEQTGEEIFNKLYVTIYGVFGKVTCVCRSIVIKRYKGTQYRKSIKIRPVFRRHDGRERDIKIQFMETHELSYN